MKSAGCVRLKTFEVTPGDKAGIVAVETPPASRVELLAPGFPRATALSRT